MAAEAKKMAEDAKIKAIEENSKRDARLAKMNEELQQANIIAAKKKAAHDANIAEAEISAARCTLRIEGMQKERQMILETTGSQFDGMKGVFKEQMALALQNGDFEKSMKIAEQMRKFVINIVNKAQTTALENFDSKLEGECFDDDKKEEDEDKE